MLAFFSELAVESVHNNFKKTCDKYKVSTEHGNYSQFLLQAVRECDTNLSAISSGFEFAWPSSGIEKLPSHLGTSITKYESFWIEALYNLSPFLFAPIAYLLVQNLGRSKTLIIAGISSTLSWTLIASATSIYQIYIARGIGGIGLQITFVVIPMYVAEISEKNIRGFLGSLSCSMHRLGIMLNYCIVPYIPIIFSSAIAGIIAFLQILTYPLRPESPYFYIQKSKKEEAIKSLKSLRAQSSKFEEELEMIIKDVEQQRTERGPIRELFLVPSNRKALLIMILAYANYVFTGVGVIVMNLDSILEESGTNIPPTLSAIIYSCTMLISSVIGGCLIDKFGRRTLLIIASVLIAFFHGILATYFYFKLVNHYDMSMWQWIPLFALIGNVISYELGLNIGTIALFSELLPINVKTMGMVLTDVIFYVYMVVTIQIYFVCIAECGLYAPFIIFAIFPVCFMFFVIYYVPETKGKSLLEIKIMLNGGTLTEDNGSTDEHF